jgi:hypothetical protein
MMPKEHKNAGPLEFARAIVAKWLAAMSGPPSVVAAAAALWVENATAKTLLGITAFVCAWVAAYVVWQSERERVLELEAKLDSKKRLAPLTGQLKVAQRLQTQKISNDEELGEFVTDYKKFVADTALIVGNNFSAVEAQAFAMHPVVSAAAIPGAFNEKHTDLLLYLKAYVDRLHGLVTKYSS